ncbi:MAG: hypothetical protein ACT4P0_11995 [Panacagrimonas sp.]
MTQPKAFGQKSDTTFWISLGVGLALIGVLGAMQWESSVSTRKVAVKTAADVQAKARSVAPVYRCNDGRVSFTPCG